ncbi:thiol reductant ABC exporter subunit CydC [Clostridium sp. DJ247]|uniref:thiol reductant ABC exporter subunit CydC n=1 Tax=Clostridium sp. DJ247 TaxID=2726188 RepID=UPI001623FFA5|nr:thiol reductant ABC exporter subunit CydC [Clostridium sp. DJ247]MBC2580414.1 thiol reductant ABC exporter subunit CydC [Clostridium sp. DJ247]
MKRHVYFIIFSIIMGVATVVSNIGMLSTSALLISRAALHSEVLDLMVLIVVVRFFGISRGVFRYFERIISHNTTFRILSSIRKWFYKRFNDNYYENNKQFKTGDIYTKIVSDVDSLKEFYLRGIYPVIIAVLTGIITFIFLSYFSKYIADTYILIYILCGFVLPAVLFSFNSKYIKKENSLREKLNLTLLDNINGILEVHVYSLKHQLESEFNFLTKEYSKIQKSKNCITSIGDNLYELFISLAVASSLIIGALAINSGNLLSIYYAVIPLAIIASFEALIPMSNIVHKFYEAYTTGKSIFSIIDKKSMKGNFYNHKVGEHDKSLIISKNTIGFNEKKFNSYNLLVKNLSVWDNNSKSHIIKDISFQLAYGKKLAIVGASGSGKTTILKTLLGFMNFQNGYIKIDNISYSDVHIDEIRKVFTYVDQDPYIFNTTIKENLLMANPKTKISYIMDLLKKFQLTSFVKDIPEGLDSLLGQYGFNISGGEKQRLALIRAILKESRIVLFDEPTASLDIKLEKEVVSFIHDMIKHKSCIWVTHRLINMDRMDEILVLDKGEIAESGTHEELVKKRGIYYKLWSAQQQYIIMK